MYDVIVIGAGPAGCTAAKLLAENGYSVLLAEKFKLPRYKSCSGVLIQKTVNLLKEYFGEEVPDSVMCTPAENRGMVFTNDRGEEYRFEQKGVNVWRSSFDSFLAEKAAESGALVLDNASVLSCEETENAVRVLLRGEKDTVETAMYVIDCEGVVGSVKRRLLGRKEEYITTYQAFYDGTINLDPHYFYAYLQPELSEYDAWFNVKDEQLVLGVSVRSTELLSQYNKRFLRYMEEHHGLCIAGKRKEEKWLMPKIASGCSIDYNCGRILFAGEAAGFLNPMGEGISAAMESGCCAARAVAGHFGDIQKIRDEYIKRCEPLREYMKRQWSFVAELADTFKEMKRG